MGPHQPGRVSRHRRTCAWCNDCRVDVAEADQGDSATVTSTTSPGDNNRRGKDGRLSRLTNAGSSSLYEEMAALRRHRLLNVWFARAGGAAGSNDDLILPYINFLLAPFAGLC